MVTMILTIFFLKYAKDLRIFVIKVEMFDINNAFQTSALRGLYDYSRGLDHPLNRKHILILHMIDNRCKGKRSSGSIPNILGLRL